MMRYVAILMVIMVRVANIGIIGFVIVLNLYGFANFCMCDLLYYFLFICKV